MEVLVLSLIRKDLISKDKLTLQDELLKFLEMESTVKLVKKKKELLLISGG
jgi:hypothetical protein